jgi:hypothetical protein
MVIHHKEDRVLRRGQREKYKKNPTALGCSRVYLNNKLLLNMEMLLDVLCYYFTVEQVDNTVSVVCIVW